MLIEYKLSFITVSDHKVPRTKLSDVLPVSYLRLQRNIRKESSRNSAIDRILVEFIRLTTLSLIQI